MVVPNNAQPKHNKLEMAGYDVTTFRLLAAELGVVLLVPVFPRDARPAPYTHALDAQTLGRCTNNNDDDAPPDGSKDRDDRDEGEEDTSDDGRYSCRRAPKGHGRIDLQLLSMITKARSLLLEPPFSMPAVQEKVIMVGFSASAMSSSRMAALHPERISAVVAGTQTLFIPPPTPPPTPTAPPPMHDGQEEEEDDGKSSRLIEKGAEKDTGSIEGYFNDFVYPVGAADIDRYTGRAFDADAYAQVAFHFFVGDRDDDDILALLDLHVPAAAQKRIWAQLGFKEPRRRFERLKQVFHRAGFTRSQFVVYPGAVHEFTPLQKAAVVDFLAQEVLSGREEGKDTGRERDAPAEPNCPIVAHGMCV